MQKVNLPYRQIHLDFHTSAFNTDVGLAFDPDTFARTLQEACVNSCTVFARCHHGHLYYESVRNPERVHPHLRRRGLLNEQVAALHNAGIRAPIYITVQWDQYTADEHPEWLTLSVDGRPAAMRESMPLQPGFFRYLCINSPYREWLKDHTREVLKHVPVDGLFFDIVWPVECLCKHCIASMKELGMSPADADDRKRHALQVVQDFTQDMTAFVREINAGCSIYYNNGDIAPNRNRLISPFTHLEFDALPSEPGGSYINFFRTVRFERTLGHHCVGMTGKFHRGWGDVHSYKATAALEYDCFRLLALNCKVLIGDQLDPSGKLDAHTYKLIGNIYRQVQAKEPWCVNARPLTDIGVLSPLTNQSAVGATRLLQESGHQFDILDYQSDLSGYKVLVLPDRLHLDDSLLGRVNTYLSRGGRILASFEAGMNPECTRFLLDAAGIELIGEGPRDLNGDLVRGRILGWKQCEFADYVVPRGAIAGGLPEVEHVMYVKGIDVRPADGAEALADLVPPVFYRTYEHFQSHMQAVSSGRPSGAAVVQGRGGIYFAHPVFELYQAFAMPWGKRMVLNALELLLPQPLLRHDGPSSVVATVNRQDALQRDVIHLLHYVPEQRATYVETVEEALPIYNLAVSYRADHVVRSVRTVPEGQPLAFTVIDGRTCFTLPRLNGHQMIEVI